MDLHQRRWIDDVFPVDLRVEEGSGGAFLADLIRVGVRDTTNLEAVLKEIPGKVCQFPCFESHA